MSEIVHHFFGGTYSQYFTSPRRTSSIAVTVGFLEVVGRNGRAPLCNCRARLPATMMKRYVLWSRSSGMAYIALLFSLSAMCLLTSILREACQDATSSPILQANRIGGLAVQERGDLEKLVAEVRRFALLHPLPSDFTGEKHVAIVKREPITAPDMEVCEFEERPDPAPTDCGEEGFWVCLTR
jgi:hypothetical protein